MHKIAVVTSLIGGREVLRNPVKIFNDIDYYAFTDQNIVGSNWKIKNPYVFSSIDSKYKNRRDAKIYKILPELVLPGYDYYIWTDASHNIIQNPYEVCEKYLSNSPIAVFKHTTRDCIYDEARILVELQYDHENNINSQIELYNEWEYPKNNGLWELSAFIKKNDHAMTSASLMWWEHICKYASRDQISFPVCLWKHNIKPNILPGFVNGYNNRGTIGNNDIIPQVWQHVSSGNG